MSYNEHTKKKMQTGIPTENYLNNFDVIFKKKEEKPLDPYWFPNLNKQDKDADNPS